MAPGKTARIGAAPAATSNPTANIAAGTSSPPTSHVPVLVAVANAFHKAAGAQEIDSYGTCAAYPNLTQGIQGLI